MASTSALGETSPAKDNILANTASKGAGERDTYSYSPAKTTPAPGQARSALEAQLADIDRRIHDASRLGTTLLEQKKQLKDRLRDVQTQDDDEDLDPGLKQKLAELEKEYHDVEKDNARSSQPKGRKPSTDFSELQAPSNAGSKLQFPSSVRRNKNESPSRVHDIEFATEISTSLLGQVRQLQALLAEKEESLKRLSRENAQLHSDMESYSGRMRGIDDNEQRYKDENWNLETQVQDLTALIKDVSSREERLKHALSSAESKRMTSEREFEELKQTHGKLSEDHSGLKRQHDLDLSSMRRDMTDADTERDLMQRRIDELTAQNGELARAVTFRAGTQGESGRHEVTTDETAATLDRSTPEHSPPPSPTKIGTPRHGALESETLKSSLTHAHRMIQNLKNNIHREKTEKVELKRMLQDARDDIEARKDDGGVAAANAGRKRKPMPGQDAFKKPARPDRLGGAKGPREEILNDPSWETYNDSPDRPRQSIEESDPYDLSTDASDAFETADERNSNDDTDAFQTGAESNAGESDGELTETEGPAMRSVSSNLARNTHDRRQSVQSTASDGGEGYDLNTTSGGLPRYKMRASRGGFRMSETPSMRDSPSSFMSNRDSPASFVSNQSQPRSKQNLAAELDDMDDSSIASATPSRNVSMPARTPDIGRQGTVIRSPTLPRPIMVDSSMLTEPWEPETKIVEVAAGTAAGTIGSATLGAAATASRESIRHLGTPEPKPQREPSPLREDTSSGSFLLRDSMIEPVSEDITSLGEGPGPQLGPALPIALQKSAIATQAIAPAAPVLREDMETRRQPSQADPSTSITAQPAPIPIAQPIAKYLQSSTTSSERGASDASSQPADLDAATSTPSFLNELLRSASRSRSGTPDSKRSITAPAVPLRAAARDVQYSGSIRSLSRAPSISSSMLAYETTPSLQPAASESAQQIAPAPSIPSNRGVVAISKQEDSSFQEPTLEISSLDEPRPSPTAFTFDSAAAATTPAKQIPSISRPTAPGLVESGTQTSVSGEQVDMMLKERARKTLANSTINGVAISTGSPRQQGIGQALPLGTNLDTQKGLDRPTSAGSNYGSPPAPNMPPLPADHREVIAAAANRSSSMVNMPPPPMATSRQHRPRTPSQNYTQSPGVKAGTAPRNRAPSVARTEMSRRSSISSFASELDERFNNHNTSGSIRGSYMNAGPEGYEMSNADPRMIQAITQTMIGEFLWKYTRKAGRGDISNNRHKRFFWIHPYTRTLYWSSHDPSATGRSEHKAKSVSIEAVRVISDDNPIPPGLHTKSIVVVTPGRSIQFTAPTSQRHETWFNALSYLLLRNNSTNSEDIMGRPTTNYNNTNTQTSGSSVVAEDLPGFTPGPAAGAGTIRATSRFSHRSLSSLNNANNRGSSAQAGALPSSPQGVNSLAMRQAAAAQKRSGSSLSQTGAQMEAAERSARRPGSSQGEDYTSAGLTSTIEEVGESGSRAGAQEDGFKKPGLPASVSAGGDASGGTEGNPLGATASTRSRKTESGRLGSLTAKLRRSSFASLGRSRGRTTNRTGSDGVEGEESIPVSRDSASTTSTAMAPSPTPAPATTAVRGAASARSGHHHHHHGAGSSTGGLENVRACCDGKHDLSTLHHRSSSRTSMTHPQGANHNNESRTSMSMAGASAAAARAITPSNPAQTNSSLRL